MTSSARAALGLGSYDKKSWDGIGVKTTLWTPYGHAGKSHSVHCIDIYYTNRDDWAWVDVRRRPQLEPDDPEWVEVIW